jgi:hypothetical protein
MLQVQLHSTAGQQEHTYVVIHHRLSQSNCTWGGEGGADRLFWCDYRPETEGNMLLQ